MKKLHFNILNEILITRLSINLLIFLRNLPRNHNWSSGYKGIINDFWTLQTSSTLKLLQQIGEIIFQKYDHTKVQGNTIINLIIFSSNNLIINLSRNSIIKHTASTIFMKNLWRRKKIFLWFSGLDIIIWISIYL